MKFVFKKLNIEQKGATGDINWRLVSPNTNYSEDKGLAIAENPEGLIFRSNIPRYRITSKNLELLENGIYF